MLHSCGIEETRVQNVDRCLHDFLSYYHVVPQYKRVLIVFILFFNCF